MKIRVNGQFTEFETQDTLSAVLKRFQIEKTDGLAVAVNCSVVPKTDLTTRTLQDGDEIEIIRATQGG